jgi:hypothetical protein
LYRLSYCDQTLESLQYRYSDPTCCRMNPMLHPSHYLMLYPNLTDRFPIR